MSLARDANPLPVPYAAGVTLDERGFRRLLEQVADGWSTGNPQQAAEAFAQDAIYVEPPRRQRYVGRDELYAFFHGPGAAPRPMRMTWHSIAFDGERQAGFGEYTFQRPALQLHGIVAIEVRNGQIATWREYQYRSELTFEAFAGDSLHAAPAAGGEMDHDEAAPGAPRHAQVIAARDGPSVWAFSGDRYTVKVAASDTAGGLGLVEALVPPGSGPPQHLHRNEDELFYVLEGRLQITAGDRSQMLEPGGMVLLPRGAPHDFRNVGDRPTRLLLMFVPGGFDRYFLEVGVPVADHAAAPGPDDFPAAVAEAVRVASEGYGIEFT